MLFHVFSDTENKKQNSRKRRYNHGDFVSTKYFPVNEVNKSTKGKASFIGVAGVH